MPKVRRKVVGDSASRYTYPVGVVEIEGSAPAVESGPAERPAPSARKAAWVEYVQALGGEVPSTANKATLIKLADEYEG